MDSHELSDFDRRAAAAIKLRRTAGEAAAAELQVRVRSVDLIEAWARHHQQDVRTMLHVVAQLLRHLAALYSQSLKHSLSVGLHDRYAQSHICGTVQPHPGVRDPERRHVRPLKDGVSSVNSLCSVLRRQKGICGRAAMSILRNATRADTALARETSCEAAEVWVEEFAEHVRNSKTQDARQAGTSALLFTLAAVAPEDAPRAAEALNSTLQMLLHSRKGSVGVAPLRATLEKYPHIALALLPELIRGCASARSPFVQAAADPWPCC